MQRSLKKVRVNQCEMGIRNCSKPPWVSVWVCELIVSIINKSNTWLLYISMDFNFCSKKSNNHLGTCQFFACSFMNPGGSLRVLVPRTGCSLILVFFQILKLGWFFNSIVFQNTQIEWFFGSDFFRIHRTVLWLCDSVFSKYAELVVLWSWSRSPPPF
jgi:hypothetical protein